MGSKHTVEGLEIQRQYLKLDRILLQGHSNGGSIALGYVQQYAYYVGKLVLLDHELQWFDDTATYMEFAMKRNDDPIYKSAMERLQIFKADTGEEMRDGLAGILPFYFGNPTDFAPKMLEMMLNVPSSWALNHHRTADRERPTYLIDDLDKVEAQTLIVVSREETV